MSRLNDKAKAAIVAESRRLDMDDGRDSALEYLISEGMGGWEGNGHRSAHRILDYETFRYINCIPEQHPLWREMRTKEDADNKRRSEARKHKPVLLARNNGRCEWCGKEVEGRNATIDHIDPEGGNEPENLALLCRRCNSRKSAGTLDRLERIDEANTRNAALNRSMECPCHHYGCPPDCPGCDFVSMTGIAHPKRFTATGPTTSSALHRALRHLSAGERGPAC